jgi:hypothetical protein
VVETLLEYHGYIEDTEGFIGNTEYNSGDSDGFPKHCARIVCNTVEKVSSGSDYRSRGI